MVGWLVARLGVVGDVQWGCKPRIEGIVKFDVHKGIAKY